MENSTNTLLYESDKCLENASEDRQYLFWQDTCSTEEAQTHHYCSFKWNLSPFLEVSDFQSHSWLKGLNSAPIVFTDSTEKTGAQEALIKEEVQMTVQGNFEFRTLLWSISAQLWW